MAEPYTEKELDYLLGLHRAWTGLVTLGDAVPRLIAELREARRVAKTLAEAPSNRDEDAWSKEELTAEQIARDYPERT